MPTGYQIYDGYGTYYLTFQVVQWADVFTRKSYRDIVCDSFNYCNEHQGLRVHAYCIMSNHVHCILSATGGNLSDVVRNFKAHTGKTMLKAVNAGGESRREWLNMIFQFSAAHNARASEHQIWTHENHAVALRSDKFFLQRLEYIHLNPVRASLVRDAEHYIYSSAADYFHRRQVGPVQVAQLEVSGTTPLRRAWSKHV